MYEVSLTGDCPYPITYLLNKDATSVTVEIVRTSDSWVAKTWSFTPPDAHCTKGIHTDLSWDPANEVPVPGAGNYKLKVSATGAAVTGYNADPKLMPGVWEALNPDGTSAGWRTFGIAVNRDPNSELYGRVYIANYATSGTPSKAKGVYEFYGDGTLKGMLPVPSEGFGSSAPWGIEFDDDNHLYIEDRSSARYFQFTWNGTSWVQTATKLCQQGRGITVTGSGADFRIAETYWAQGASTIPPSNNSRIAFGTSESPAPPDIRSPLAYGAAIDDTFVGSCFVGTDLYIAGTVGAAPTTPEPGGISVWDTTGMLPWSGPAIRYPNYSRATGIDVRNGTVWLGRIAGLVVAGEYDYTDTRDTDVAHQTIYKFPLGDIATIDPYNSPPATFKTYGVGTAYTGNQWPYFVKADPAGNLALTGGTTWIGGTGYFFGVYEEPLGVPTAHTTTSRMEVYWPGEYVPEYISGGAVPGESAGNPIVADGATPTRVTVVAEDRNNTPTVNDIAAVRVHCPSVGWGTVAGGPSSGWPMTVRSRDGYQNTYWNDATVAVGSGAGWHTVKVYLWDVHYGDPPNGVPIQEGEFQMYVSGGKISGRITEGTTNYPAANVRVKTSYTDGNGETFTTEALTNSNGEYLIDATANPAVSIFLDQYPEWGSNPVRPGSTRPAEYNVMSNWPSGGDNDWASRTVSVTLGQTTTGVNGRVWPLAVTQVIYDWAVAAPKPGGRTVCLTGTVIRQAQDTARSHLGFNGYYWLYDTRYAGTVMSCKVWRNPADPEIVERDKVVVIGNYTKESGHSYGEITRDAALVPVVTAENQAMPNPYYMDNSSPMGWTVGRYQGFRDGVVTEAGADYFVAQFGAGPSSVTVRVDTPASTGVTVPVNGDRLDCIGMLDEYGAGGQRVLKPGKATDVDVVRTLTTIGDLKKTADGTRIFANVDSPAIVTYVDPGDTYQAGTSKYVWVESPDRTAALKVNTAGSATGPPWSYMPVDLQAGMKITNMKGLLVLPANSELVDAICDGSRELRLTQMPTVDTNVVDLPKFLSTNFRSYGGGWFGGQAPVVEGVGLNMEGLVVQVTGKVLGYGEDATAQWDWMYIEDGSNKPMEGGYTGVKVIRRWPLGLGAWPMSEADIGKQITVQGICANRWISGVGRVRMLLMRTGNFGADIDVSSWVSP